MHSEIASRLELRYSPVAIVLTDEKLANANEFTEGRWGLRSLFADSRRQRTQGCF